MEDGWISRCLEAAASKQNIKQSTSKTIESILRGDGGCRKLTNAEVVTAAANLLAAEKAAAAADEASTASADEQAFSSPTEGEPK